MPSLRGVQHRWDHLDEVELGVLNLGEGFDGDEALLGPSLRVRERNIDVEILIVQQIIDHCRLLDRAPLDLERTCADEESLQQERIDEHDAIESLAPLFASGRDEHSHVSSEPADELQSIYEWCATLEAPHPLVSEIVQGAGAEGIDIKELHSQMLCQSCELVDELYLRGLALSTSPLAGKTLAARTALNHADHEPGSGV